MVQEIYWHINKVWNGRNFTQEKIDSSYDKDFDNLCKFPDDLDI
jgi:hypothetical protein